jgi:hypothetical protein
MSIVFDNNKLHNRSRPQTVESAFTTYASWAGIHQFKYDDEYAEATRNVSKATGDWEYDVIDYGFEPNFYCEYHVSQCLGHGVVVKYIDAESHWVVGISPSGDAEVWSDTAGLSLLKYRMPVDVPSEGDVRVSFRQIRMSDSADDLWDAVSMWINDRLIFTYTEHVGVVINETVKFGFASYDSTYDVTNFRVPLLSAYTEWASLDPGEAPAGGLQRVIEGQYTKHFIRFDGSLRAWRPQTNSSEYTFPEHMLEYTQDKFDKRGLFTHIRMMGAYEQAEYHREDLSAKFGHRFMETNNPYLMSERECYIQAQLEIKRMEEAATEESIRIPFRPLLELEDHITTDRGERIISSRRWRFTATQIEEEIKAREYTYGS